MPFAAPPATAAWRHRDVRDGFEVVHFHPLDDGWRIEGSTTAVEDGDGWAVGYEIVLDATWTTRRARLSGLSASGWRSTVLESDGVGHWKVDGRPAPHIGGCLDVDLESSAMTNAFPVRRASLPIDMRMEAPAAYVRALDLAVERLEQSYVRLQTDGTGERYAYTAPAFDVACVLVYDGTGLVIDYPGIATRAG